VAPTKGEVKHDVKTIDTLFTEKRGEVSIKIGFPQIVGGLERRVIGRRVDPFAQRFEQLPAHPLRPYFTTRHRYRQASAAFPRSSVPAPGHFPSRIFHNSLYSSVAWWCRKENTLASSTRIWNSDPQSEDVAGKKLRAARVCITTRAAAPRRKVDAIVSHGEPACGQSRLWWRGRRPSLRRLDLHTRRCTIFVPR